MAKPLPPEKKSKKMGRPPLYNNCMDLDCMCELYFEDADERGAPYTVPSLAIFLGFASRHSVWELGQKQDYSHTIKKALGKIESQRIEAMVSGKGNVAGQIFDLKNNFNYVDKQVIDQSVTDKTDRAIERAEEEILRKAADKLRRARLKVVGAPSE